MSSAVTAGAGGRLQGAGSGVGAGSQRGTYGGGRALQARLPVDVVGSGLRRLRRGRRRPGAGGITGGTASETCGITGVSEG